MKNTGFLIFLLSSITPVLALNIQLDFLHDEEADRFFVSNPEAKSAVEKAAEDLGNMLSNSLHQVKDDLYIGANGSTTAQFDWSWSYINPVTGMVEVIHNPSIDSDTVIIYVGTRAMTDESLGRGGAGGASVQLSGSGLPTEWIGAVDNAEALSNATMRRGSGPLINSISGAANYSGYVGSYDLEYGLSVGNLWFDADTNNDGKRDSDAELEEFWHYDANAPVAAGKTDLYSVALHEIMHVLGAGTSTTWIDNIDKGDWLGSEATKLAGTADLIDPDGYHLYDTLLSRRVSDGALQHTALSLDISPGERKELTELDLAFLQDIGFETVQQVPEPSTTILCGLGAIVMLSRRSRVSI